MSTEAFGALRPVYPQRYLAFTPVFVPTAQGDDDNPERQLQKLWWGPQPSWPVCRSLGVVLKWKIWGRTPAFDLAL